MPTPDGLVQGAAIAAAASPGGYAWWYVEAHDAQNQHALTLIFFAGAVFSPWYAAQVRAGHVRTGLEYPAVNLVVYERSAGAALPSKPMLWVMNEYEPAALSVAPDHLTVADSHLRVSPSAIEIQLRERATHFFGRPGAVVTASIRLTTDEPMPRTAPLLLGSSPAGARHAWQAIAPLATAHVELTCDKQRLRFSGRAYCDRNFGSGRLEDTFRRWTWAHGFQHDPQAGSLILYQAEHLDGSVSSLGVRSVPAASRRHSGEWIVEGGAWRATPGSRTDFVWLSVPKAFSVGAGSAVRTTGSGHALLDAPFYARYLTQLSDADSTYQGVGEYLDLQRFSSRAVQHLLRYKIQRSSAPGRR